MCFKNIKICLPPLFVLFWERSQRSFVQFSPVTTINWNWVYNVGNIVKICSQRILPLYFLGRMLMYSLWVCLIASLERNLFFAIHKSLYEFPRREFVEFRRLRVRAGPVLRGTLDLTQFWFSTYCQIFIKRLQCPSWLRSWLPDSELRFEPTPVQRIQVGLTLPEILRIKITKDSRMQELGYYPELPVLCSEENGKCKCILLLHYLQL